MKITLELVSGNWLVSMEHPLLGKKSLGPGAPRPSSFVEACELARRLIHHASNTTIADIHLLQDSVDRKPETNMELHENVIRGPWSPAERPEERDSEESEEEVST